MAKYIINERITKKGLVSVIAVIKVTLDDNEDGSDLAITPDLQLQSIASPIDMLELPIDIPDTAGGLFRVDQVSVIVNGTNELTEILDFIQADIKSNFAFQEEGYSKEFSVTVADTCLVNAEQPCVEPPDNTTDPVPPPPPIDPHVFVVIGVINPEESSSASTEPSSSG